MAHDSFGAPPTGTMAPKKAATILVKLLSTAGTGYFYVAKRNPRKLVRADGLRSAAPSSEVRPSILLHLVSTVNAGQEARVCQVRPPRAAACAVHGD